MVQAGIYNLDAYFKGYSSNLKVLTNSGKQELVRTFFMTSKILFVLAQHF